MGLFHLSEGDGHSVHDVANFIRHFRLFSSILGHKQLEYEQKANFLKEEYDRHDALEADSEENIATKLVGNNTNSQKYTEMWVISRLFFDNFYVLQYIGGLNMSIHGSFHRRS